MLEMTLCKELFNESLMGLVAEPFRDVRGLSTGGAGGGGKFKRSLSRAPVPTFSPLYSDGGSGGMKAKFGTGCLSVES